MRITSITAEHYIEENAIGIALVVTPAEEGRELIERIREASGHDTLPNEIGIEVKKVRKKKSLDQNAYLWTLIKKLAKKLQVPYTEVYINVIREGGEYEVMPIRDDAVGTWVANWQTRGIGWVCEVLGKSKIEGYTNVKTYYGTSVYDSKQMARLLDIVIDECKSNGIEVLSPVELARMRELEERNGH